MNKPLVSILIANLNNGKYIKETLQSAINQSYKNIEIIVVDDASEDNSIDVIRNFIENNKTFDINLYRNYTSHGCGRIKRKCADISRGKYFAFLDPDDTIAPTAVEELVAIHEKNNSYSIVYSTHYLCDEELEPQGISTWPGKIDKNESHLNSISGHISAFAMCKKSDYDQTEGINPTYIVAEDMDLYLKMEEIAPVYYLDKPLYYYRKHNNNMSWSYEKRYINLYWRYQAEMAAYYRRKKNVTAAVNLSRKQLYRKKFDFNMQYAKLYRSHKKYAVSIVYNLKAIPYLYTLLFDNEK